MKPTTSLALATAIAIVLTSFACHPSSKADASAADANRQPGREHAEARHDRIDLSADEIDRYGIETSPPAFRFINGQTASMGKINAHPQRLAIVSYPYPSRVAVIHVSLGRWVNRGDLLLTLESEVVGEAKSGYLRMKTDFELARVQFERTRGLFDKGAVSQRSKQEAEAAFMVAKTALETADKRLHVLGFSEEQVQELARDHQIRPRIGIYAPLSGKIVKQQAVLGGMVDQGTEIMTILDPRVVCVDAEIYEHDLSAIELGQPATLTVPAFPSLTFTGVISYIGDMVNEETRTVTVRFEVKNDEGRLKPGMFASVRIETVRNERALVVPASSILLEKGRNLLFVKENSGFRPRFVKTGVRSGGMVEVREADLAGRAVVSRGAYALKARWQRRHGRHVHGH